MFGKILSMGRLSLIIYPPGSGKSTTALLLQSYLSATAVWSDKLSKFFENCEFAKSHKNEFDHHKASSNVAYISFDEIRGSNRNAVERSLSEIMLKCFQAHFSETVFCEEENALEILDNVYGSLSRFCIELYDKTKTSYVLLDSCDTVYDAISQLGADAAGMCKKFTKFIKSGLFAGRSGIKLICFGVSPYLAHEFSGIADIRIISSRSNELGQFFSYSIETINKVIEKWELNTSVDECLKVAEFKYDDRIFINPAICVSFLRSLYFKKDKFQVDIIPRSLWLGSIFTIEDRDLLLDVLKSSCTREFEICVTIIDIIEDQIQNRQLYYPLFIYGGFISCKRCDKNKYELSAANQVAKCILEKTLNDIYM